MMLTDILRDGSIARYMEHLRVGADAQFVGIVGPYAWGTAKEDTILDIIVVLQPEVMKIHRDRVKKLRADAEQFNLPVKVVVYFQPERLAFSKSRKAPCTVCDSEGRVVSNSGSELYTHVVKVK